MEDIAADSIETFCGRFKVGQTTAFKEIRDGRLKAVKVGRRTLIPHTASAEWLKSLPTAGGEQSRAA